MKKTKSCKLMCMLLVLAMLLGLFAGCAARGGEATNPPATTEPTQSGGPDVTEPSGGEDTTEPTGTEPADPGATEPTVTDPSDATEPTDVTGPADVTEPIEPADPTEPTPPVETEPGHEHEYGKTVTAATCTEDGFATYTCKGCGDSYVGELTPAVGHKYGEWATTEEPSEAAEGAAERTCSTCGGKETKVLDKLIPNHTHSYTGKVTKKATCTTEGVKTYTCSCGSSYTEAIAKTAHKYKKKYQIADCYQIGFTTYTCENCGYSYTGDYKPKTTHSYATEYLKPNCEDYGFTLHMCDYCLDWYETDIIPALGHDYIKTVIAPTCTEKGYTLYECSRCDKSYKGDYIDPIDHDYQYAVTIEPSININGYTVYSCNACGAYYKDNCIPAIPQEEFERMVADATVKYINQFRKEQGDTEAVKLPGLTQVAEYRAVQLQTNFEHSTADLREAYAYYKYGEWVDGTLYGGTQQYYTAHAKEAIAARGMIGGSPDEVGRQLAEQFLNSKNHWVYVGSSDYAYIGVGISYNENAASGYDLHCCVLQTSKNYG